VSIKPILHYDFEHFTEDGKVEDISDNSYHGTINGATRCEDMWGNANSAYSMIDSNNVNAGKVDISDGFTIVTNINIDDVTATTRICGNQLGLTTDGTNGFALALANNTRLYLDTYSSNTRNDSFTYENMIPSDRWITLVVVKYIDDILFMLNGEDIGANTVDVDYTVNTSDDFIVGGMTARDTGLDMSEFKLYDTPLTVTQSKHISQQMMRKYGRQ